jgi:hypothetical protein
VELHPFAFCGHDVKLSEIITSEGEDKIEYDRISVIR